MARCILLANRFNRERALVFAGGLCLLASALAGSPPKLDRSWDNYYNTQKRYCVDYPSRWVSGEAFEGAGFFLKPGPETHLKLLTEIDVAALPDQGAGRSLPEEAEAHLDSLRKFELAESFRVLERRDTLLFGVPAFFIKYSYFDPQNRTTIIDETVFAAHEGMLYRLELATRAVGELKRFDLVFQRLVGSFRFDCAPHPLPRSFAASRVMKPRPIQVTRPAISTPHPVGN